MVYLIVVVALIIIYLLLGYVVFSKAFIDTKKHPYEDEQYLRNRLGDEYDSIMSWYRSISYKEIYLTSNDGLELYGRYFENKNAKRVVILVHGYTAVSNRLLGIARFFYKNDSSVLLVDQRGHGKSGGKYVSFGFYESQDLLKWIERVKQLSSLPIVLFGQSMGAATIMLLSDNEDERINLLIEDCGYATAKDEVKYLLRKKSKGLLTFTYPAVSLFARLIGKFKIEDASPIKHICNSKYPILVIHGSKDDFVPTCYSNVVYDNISSSKDILIVEDAIHAFSYTKDPKLVEKFILKHLK